ncbi:hypothetical protein [Nonomuraea sp. SYSU D8015]|uniref:hypothetical protein n=1 Tax=Nonomuraea sp. SYSU D8015 TaxID=2593644 RepID=UPI0016614591|nr:hypothetical protein [Nonomuraea sp. SYSU D8015]
MRGTYTDILPQWRVELRAFPQEVWERALAEQAWFSLHSPVRMLDDLLAPFRDGRKTPIAPFGSSGKVIELRSWDARQTKVTAFSSHSIKKARSEMISAGRFTCSE